MVKESGIIPQIRAILDKGEFSQSKIAGEIGISSSALSQYLKGKYPGDSASIESALQAFIVRQNNNPKQETMLFYPDGIVETKTTKTVRDLAITAYQDGEICVLCGAAGSGKTSGIKAYAYQNGGTIVITANTAYTQRALFSEIAENIGESPNGTIISIYNRIKRKLNGIRKTIIIDEAEHLPYRALDLLRSLQDECKFGLVMVGTEKLYYNLKGNQNQYSQLYSRIAVYRKTEEMTQKDVENAAEIYGVSKSVFNHCAVETGRNFRSTVKLAKNAKRLSEIKGREIDGDCIAFAKSALVS